MTEPIGPDPSQAGTTLSRSLAKIGMSIFGPLAFFTGLFTALTIPGGPPIPLVVVFVVSLVATGLLAAVYLMAWLGEREQEAG